MIFCAWLLKCNCTYAWIPGAELKLRSLQGWHVRNEITTQMGSMLSNQSRYTFQQCCGAESFWRGSGSGTRNICCGHRRNLTLSRRKTWILGNFGKCQIKISHNIRKKWYRTYRRYRSCLSNCNGFCRPLSRIIIKVSSVKKLRPQPKQRSGSNSTTLHLT